LDVVFIREDQCPRVQQKLNMKEDSIDQSINQSINHAAGDAPYVSLKQQIAFLDSELY